MARRTTFTADDILDAAMAVMEAHGRDALTARRVALHLGASTAPVYSNFTSMEELQGQALARTDALLLDYCLRPWTDERFLNMGIGYLRFARDHPNLFKALYYEPRDDHCPMAPNNEVLLGVLEAHPLLGTLPRAVLDELLFQAAVYSHGLAALICSGLWRDPDLDLATQMLRNLGGLLVRAALESVQRPVPPEMVQRFGEGAVPWRRRDDDRQGEDDDA